MRNKIILSLIIPLLLFFSCGTNIFNSEEEYDPIEKFKSEIYLIDITKGTNQQIGEGWKPQFSSQDNRIIFIQKMPNYEIKKKILAFDLSGKNEYQVTEYYESMSNTNVARLTGNVIFSAFDFSGLNQDVYTVKEDGSGFNNLTHTFQINEYNPSFSEDGQKVCFKQIDYQKDSRQLVLMDLYGQKKILKTSYVNDFNNATFVLDDTKIIFSEDVPQAGAKKTVMMIDIDNPMGVDTLDTVSSGFFTTDNNVLIYNEGYNTIKSFDLLTREEKVISEGSLRAVSADGNKIIYRDTYRQSYFLILTNSFGGKCPCI